MEKRGRKAATVLVGLMALAGPRAATAESEPGFVLHVANYAGLSPGVLDETKARLLGVYGAIGVGIEWIDGREVARRVENGKLHLSVMLLSRDMRSSATGEQHNLLGQANMPLGRAYIFCDRIAALHRVPAAFSTALAHVVAHEVGHLLLRENGHSRSGIMRADVPGYTSHLQTFSSTEARAIRVALLAMD
jgi:hypothetical protein